MLTAIPVTLLVAFLPGALLGFLAPPGRLRWAAWAASPVLTLGLTGFAMAWLQVLHLPSGAIPVLIGAVATAVGIAVLGQLWRVRRGEPTGWREWIIRSPLPPARDLLAVAVPAAVCVAFGEAMVGRFRYPPGWDGQNHAMLTRSILDTGSTAVHSVCTTGYQDALASCSFYPLAANVSWAQITTLSGGRVSSAMLAWSVVIAPLILVLASYAAARLLGARPLIAACAATVPAVIGPLWKSMSSGRVTEQAGAGLAIGLAILLTLALRSRRPVAFGVLSGVGVAGILLTHTYDVLFAGSLTVALILIRPGRWSWRSVWRGVAGTIVTTAVVIGPIVGDLLSASGERAQTPPLGPHQYGLMFHFWFVDYRRYLLFGYPAPGTSTVVPLGAVAEVALWIAIICLFASPLCYFFAHLKWAWPWPALWLVWNGIGWWTSVAPSGPANTIAGFWYGTVERLRDMIAPVYGLTIVAGAAGLGAVLGALIRLLRRATGPTARGRPTRHLPGLLSATCGLAVTVALVSLAATPSARQPLRTFLTGFTAHGPMYDRTFQWLATHTPAGDIVAYDRGINFMTWSYADYGVPYLFGITPIAGRPAAAAEFDDRWQAWYWLVNDPDAQAAGCLVRKYRIAYVVVGGPLIAGSRPDYSWTRLANNPRLRLVHSDGPLRVYAVTAAGRAC